MSSTIKVNSLPIRYVQTKISDFSWLLNSYCYFLRKKAQKMQLKSISNGSAEKFVLYPDNLILLEHPHCKKHGLLLAKNGINKRTIFSSEGKIYTNLSLQRYRCKKCGEYKPNYGKFFPKFANYQKEIKAKARHLFFLGIIPVKIVKIFRLFCEFAPSESSIRNWVKKTYESIKEVVENTTLPVSGYFGYDEIHTRTNGKRAYILSLVDLWDGFYVNAQFSPDMDNRSIKQFLSKAKHRGKIKLKGLVMDGSNTYGGIFKSWRYKYIKVQRCQTHYKKNLNEAIYKAAGLGKRLKKDLPEPYSELKKALFAVFNRSTLFRAIIQLVHAETRFYGKISEEVDKIIDHFYKHFQNLFRYHIDSRLKRTNNAAERMNLDLQRHPTLKTRMKTAEGVNCVVKGIVFLHNYDAFHTYISNIEKKILGLDQNIATFPDDRELKNLKRGLAIHLHWVRKFYRNYQEIYERYFKLKLK